MKSLKNKNTQQLHFFKRLGFVTLVEVLIAMALTILVLTTLTYFYRQVFVIGASLDEVQKKSFQMRYLENRFADVFPKAISEKDPDKDFVFFTVSEEPGLTKSNSLIFTYDNGVDIDKPFANHVIGRLFIDPQDRLVLAYWPSPKRWEGNPTPPMKKEILMEGVNHMAFEFFIAPDKEQEPQPPPQEKENGVVEPEPKGDWRINSWPQEFKQLPAMIRITLTPTQPNGKLVFVFPFPNTKRPITYDQ